MKHISQKRCLASYLENSLALKPILCSLKRLARKAGMYLETTGTTFTFS